MAMLGHTIDQGKRSPNNIREEVAQGANVGDRALGRDGRIYDWSGVSWNLAGDQSGATDQDFLKQRAKEKMVNEVTQIINDLEDKIVKLQQQGDSVVLSDAELQNFIAKATAEVKGYYDDQMKLITDGIQEGKIRNAEDMFKFMRDTETNYRNILGKYDIEQAETEEDFINKMADITAGKDEDISLKRDDWRNRLQSTQMSQVKGGTLTSGIGQKQMEDLRARQAMEEANIERQYGAKATSTETAKKYDMERIMLARQQAEAERLNRVGTPEQQAAAQAELRGTLGLAEGQAAPSDLEMQQRRAAANITVRKPEEVSALNEMQKEDVETRRQTLELKEKDRRQQEYEQQIKILQTEQAKKQRELQNYQNM